MAICRDDAALVTALKTLAGIYRASDRFGKAEPFYPLALAEKTFPAGDRNIAAVFNGYAELLRKMGKLDEAAKLQGRVLRAGEPQADGCPHHLANLLGGPVDDPRGAWPISDLRRAAYFLVSFFSSCRAWAFRSFN